MQKLIYYIASSLDGFIATEDGSFSDFVMDDEIVAHFIETLGHFGTVVMGRYTYEVGLREGKTNPYPMLDTYVMSRSLQQTSYKEVTIISTDCVENVRRIKEEAGRPLWLCGGGEAAGQLLHAGLIDEIWLKLNPILLGRGIPLFRSEYIQLRLDRIDVNTFESGIVLLKYKVLGARLYPG